MKKIGYRIDKDGFITSSVVYDVLDDLDDNLDVSDVSDDISNLIKHDLQNGLYVPKWDGEKWIESLSDDEIAKRFGSPLSHVQTAKIKELDLKCKEIIYGRFKSTINGDEYEFSYDSEAQKRFNGIGTLIYTGKIKEIDWTAYDSTGKRVRLTLDSSSFETVGMSALLHQNNNIVKYNLLLEQVNKAVTVEEVNAIVWED